MTDAAAAKTRVRGGHKGSVTKLLREAETLLSATPPDATQLAAMRMSLQEKLTVLDTLDEEIISLTESEDEIDNLPAN